jgi:hypothetical protein
MAKPIPRERPPEVHWPHGGTELAGRFVVGQWGTGRVDLSLRIGTENHLLGSLVADFREVFEVADALSHVPRDRWIEVARVGAEALGFGRGR